MDAEGYASPCHENELSGVISDPFVSNTVYFTYCIATCAPTHMATLAQLQSTCPDWNLKDTCFAQGCIAGNVNNTHPVSWHNMYMLS